MPARTIAPATPTPPSLTPKSVAAKLTVWVNRVLTNADDIDAAARIPSTRSWRGSSRSGGAHHGVGAPVSWWACPGRRPRRPIAHPRGSANSHANHGSDQRYDVVSRHAAAPSAVVASTRRS